MRCWHLYPSLWTLHWYHQRSLQGCRPLQAPWSPAEFQALLPKRSLYPLPAPRCPCSYTESGRNPSHMHPEALWNRSCQLFLWFLPKIPEPLLHAHGSHNVLHHHRRWYIFQKADCTWKVSLFWTPARWFRPSSRSPHPEGWFLTHLYPDKYWKFLHNTR